MDCVFCKEEIRQCLCCGEDHQEEGDYCARCVSCDRDCNHEPGMVVISNAWRLLDGFERGDQTAVGHVDCFVDAVGD